MPNIQIKDVPAETHEVLTRRAAANKQSLQAFLLELLNDQARRPTLRELFDEIDARETGGSITLEESVNLIREIRDERDAELEGR